MRSLVAGLVSLALCVGCTAGLKGPEKRPERPVAAVKATPPLYETYTFQAGDTYWELSRRFRGTGFEWPLYWLDNRHLTPQASVVKVGTTVILRKNFPEVKVARARRNAARYPGPRR